jgi:hypothetical protein
LRTYLHKLSRADRRIQKNITELRQAEKKELGLLLQKCSRKARGAAVECGEQAKAHIRDSY